MLIRLGTLAEAIEIDAHVEEFEHGHIQAKRKKFETNSLLVLIAEINGKNVGYSISYDEFEDGSLYACYGGVLKEYRKRGVYSEIAKEREKLAKQKGYTSIKLYTRNRRREILQYLIVNGWNVVGFIKKEEVGDNRVLFEKIL